MKKTGLKTFVCSFVFSLFAIFCINGAVLYGRSKETSNIHISNKNITLFLKKEALESKALRPVPVKKIALRVLPEAKKEKHTPDIQPKEIIPLSFDDEIVLAQSISEEIAPQIPLEIDSSLAKPKENKEKVVENYQKIINAPPPNESNLAIVYQQDASPPEETSGKVVVAENKKIIKEKSFEPRKPQELVLAQEETLEGKPNILASYEEKKAPLIPLQKETLSNQDRSKKVIIADKHTKNQIALVDANVPIKSMQSSEEIDGKNDEGISGNSEEWKTMAEKNVASGGTESPWVAAKGSKHPKNNMVLKSEYFNNDEQIKKEAPKAEEVMKSRKHLTNEGVKLASETMKNILIPIPEDILKEENLVPQLASSKNENDEEIIQKSEEQGKIKGEQKPLLVPMSKKEEPLQETPLVNEENDKKSNLLSSLSAIFSSPNSAITDPNTKERNKADKNDGILSTIRKKALKKDARPKIIPVEIRLSFQPNKAEISGQTLRWIHAFANKTLEDAGTGIEVRIDGTSSMELQQKRLNLLHNILTNNGVEYSKINTVFTTREPNSFIIRTVKLNNANAGNMSGNKIVNNEGYYMQW